MPKTCPTCGTINSDDHTICANCGTALVTKEQFGTEPISLRSAAQTPTAVSVPIYASNTSADLVEIPEKHFPALKAMAMLLKVLSWILLALSILAAILFIVLPDWDLAPMMQRAAPGVMAIGAVLAGVVYFFILQVAAQMIQLKLQIEQNTRETHNTLIKLLRK